MSSEFFCKICNIACNGKAPYEQHINSAKHIKLAKLNEPQNSSVQSSSTSVKESPSTTNNTTSLVITTNDELSSSLATTTLTISPETMRILLEWNHPRNYKPYCDICQLVLHGGNNADVHFSSTNQFHNQKLAALKRIEEKVATYYCKICAEIFTNRDSMGEHFKSDQHRTSVQQKDDLQKFIKIYETYNKLKEIRKERKNAEDQRNVQNLEDTFKNLEVNETTQLKQKSKGGLNIDLSRLQRAIGNVVGEDD